LRHTGQNRRYEIAAFSSGHYFPKEIRLSLYGLMLFICMALYVSFLIYSAVSTFEDGGFEIFDLVVDLFGCINPFALVLLSSLLREKVADYLVFSSQSVRLKEICEHVLLVFVFVHFAIIFVQFCSLISIFVYCGSVYAAECQCTFLNL
jgi:hypothetical protein